MPVHSRLKMLHKIRYQKTNRYPFHSNFCSFDNSYLHALSYATDLTLNLLRQSVMVHYRRQASKRLFPEIAQDSWGSCPTTSTFVRHSNSPCSRILRPSLALCQHSITGWTVGIDTKACYSHYFPFIWGMSYSNILFLAELTSLESRQVILSRYHSPILFSLLFTSPSTWYICLVSAQKIHSAHTSYLTHQKKYCSFINYALNHYQVPPLSVI